jgi:hypothetical protein
MVGNIMAFLQVEKCLRAAANLGASDSEEQLSLGQCAVGRSASGVFCKRGGGWKGLQKLNAEGRGREQISHMAEYKTVKFKVPLPKLKSSAGSRTIKRAVKKVAAKKVAAKR